MALTHIIDNKVLEICERFIFLVLFLFSLFYNFYITFILRAVFFVCLVIHCLSYFINFLRDSSKKDNKLEKTSEVRKDMNCLDDKSKEVKAKIREEHELGHKEEIIALWEQLRIYEEKIELMNVLNHMKCKDLEEENKKLEKEKVLLANDLEKEREKVSRLEEKVSRLEEICATLSNEKIDEKEGVNVSKSEEIYATLKEKNAYLSCDLELHDNYSDELDKQFRKLEVELNGEREKVSKLEEEKAGLVKEVEEERGVKESYKVTIAELKEVAETLKENLVSLHDIKEDTKNKAEEKKKISKLEKKCKKLKTERTLWDAQRKNLLMVINSQESMVEVYKDMLDKEDCLIKLFEFCKSIGSNLIKE